MHPRADLRPIALLVAALTPQTLATLIAEYGHGLARIEAEKELQKQIIARAESGFRASPATFKRAAVAFYKDQVAELRDSSQEVLDFLVELDSPASAK